MSYRSSEKGTAAPIYQKPEVRTIESAELLAELGPALAIYGESPDIDPAQWCGV